MRMTKGKYAQKIAELIGAEVTQVVKANGVIYTGVQRKEEDSRIAPVIYIDDMYKDELPVEVAAEKVDELINENKDAEAEFDIDRMTDWNYVKPRLRAALYNERSPFTPFISADEYGFDDLIIITYIQLNVSEKGVASVKITNDLLRAIGVTKDELFKAAMENSKAEYEIISMADLAEQFKRKLIIDVCNDVGDPVLAEMIVDSLIGRMEEDRTAMMIVSNKRRYLGAINAILNKEAIEEMYPDGYILLPSSIHEMIILPNKGQELNKEEINNMIVEVNGTQVAPEEVLGDRAYYFD